MSKKDLFIDKIKEMFQIDNNLDFGIYRVINARKKEIENYMDKTLPVKIEEELKRISDLNKGNNEEINELKYKIKTLKEMNDNGEFSQKIEKLGKDMERLENSIAGHGIDEEIYDHLLIFFSRYYDDGDFISQRRYKNGVYAIPYSGEEVKLHWANCDQYYIKTGENFKDYAFNITDNIKISFKLTDAEIDRDNNKSDEKRVFALIDKTDTSYVPIEIIENSDKTQAEFILRFVYKYGKGLKQSDFIHDAVAQLKKFLESPDISNNVKASLKMLLENADGNTSHIEYHLNKYTAKNSFDYFIHKDLKKFLLRELDFYIKNEIVFFQDLYGISFNIRNLEIYIAKARIIWEIGSDIIAFLGQLEDFQKELYLKKKFVTETNYCITLDRVDEKFYDEIANNDRQIQEWVKLFYIEEISGGGNWMY